MALRERSWVEAVFQPRPAVGVMVSVAQGKVTWRGEAANPSEARRLVAGEIREAINRLQNMHQEITDERDD